MKIITDREAEADKSLVRAAWRSAETFALVPEKGNVSTEWLSTALARIPDRLRRGHFALLSSGSTGAAKLVLGSRERAENLVDLLHRMQESDAVKTALCTLPLTYSFAFVNQWLWSLMHDRPFLRSPGLRSPAAFGADLAEARDSMLCLVGIQVPLILEAFGSRSFPEVARIHFAGGRFPQERLAEIRSRFPRAKIFNNFGCVEAMPRLTLRNADEGDRAEDVGRPLPGVRLRAELAGDLVFSSPFGAVGWVDGEQMRVVEPEEWIPTGDLAELDSRGHWILKGRTTEVFKRHGEKISLPELKRMISASWKGESVFYLERDPMGEEAHVLVLCPTPESPDVQAVLQQFRRTPSRAHWPTRVESIRELPLLPNGKADLLKIRDAADKVIHWRQRL